MIGLLIRFTVGGMQFCRPNKLEPTEIRCAKGDGGGSGGGT